MREEENEEENEEEEEEEEEVVVVALARASPVRRCMRWKAGWLPYLPTA